MYFSKSSATRFFVCFFLMAFCASWPAYADQGVATAGVNLRNSPGTGNNRIGSIPRGQSFEILGRQGNWVKVRYGNKTGYVYKDYVRTSTGGSTSTASTSSQAVVTAGVNFRAVNNRQRVIGGIPRGATIDVIAREGNWYRVRYNGKEGLVFKDYVNAQPGGLRESSDPRDMPVDSNVPVVLPRPASDRPSAPASTTVTTPTEPTATTAVEAAAQVAGDSTPNASPLSVKETPTSVMENPVGAFLVSPVKVPLREAPNSGAFSDHFLNGDEVVEILGKKGDWLYVQRGNRRGWIPDQRLDYEGEIKEVETRVSATLPVNATPSEALAYFATNPDPNFPPVEGQGVTTANLNLRRGDNSVILTIPKSSSVEVVGQQGDWLKVKYTKNGEEHEGWVAKEFMNYDTSAPTIASTQAGVDCANCDDAPDPVADLRAVASAVTEIPPGYEGNTCVMNYIIEKAKASHWTKRSRGGGACALAVREILNAAGYRTGGGMGHAKHMIRPVPNLVSTGKRGDFPSGDDFEDLGFFNALQSGMTPKSAPDKSILVYQGPTMANYNSCGGRDGNWAGHVEIKEHDTQYYYDASVKYPITAAYGDQCRRLIGVMMPGPTCPPGRCSPQLQKVYDDCAQGRRR